MNTCTLGKNQQKILEEFCTKKVPVSLTNCQINTKMNNKLEVALRSYTKIEESNVQFKMQDSKTLGSEIIELKNLSQKEEYDKVTIRAQVVKLAEPAAVRRGLTKQEVTIADSTEAALLTLWEADINTPSGAIVPVQPNCRQEISRQISTLLPGKRCLR